LAKEIKVKKGRLDVGSLIILQYIGRTVKMARKIRFMGEMSTPTSKLPDE